MKLRAVVFCAGLLAVLLYPLPATATSIAPGVLQRAHAQVAPALCRIVYTSHVTSPATGETSRRTNNALGLVVRPDGLLMANGHLVRENSRPVQLIVVVGDGNGEREYTATLLGKPADVNVTFLQIDSEETLDLPHVRFAPRPRLALGEPVTAIGMLGASLDYARTLYEARIGAVLEEPRTTYCLDRSVQFGFVGAPVIDRLGNVAGVIGYELSAAEGGELYTRSGHPLIFQSELLRPHIAEPPRDPSETIIEGDAWLGVFTQPLTDDFATYWGVAPTGGLIVSTVVPGSPAAEAGLLAGDIIKRFGTTRVEAKLDREVPDFTRLVRTTGAGETVAMQVLREGEPQTLEVTLGDRPRAARDAAEFEDEALGLTVRELTTDVRLALSLPDSLEGVIVRRVRSGSPAQLSGVRPGVVVLGLGDTETPTVAAYRDAVEALAADQPAEVPVFARIGANTGFFRLEPRWEGTGE